MPDRAENNALRRPSSNNKVMSSSSALVLEDNKDVCNLDGSFEPPADEIIIDYEQIRRMDKSLMSRTLPMKNM